MATAKRINDGMMSARARAVKAWLESDEGIRCAAGPAEGQYLKNRLWRAFLAGFSSAEALTHDALDGSSRKPTTRSMLR